MIKEITWESAVRDYEVDFQGIVNNSVYFNYLDHARYLFLLEKQLNLTSYAQTGVNLVLTECNIQYKNALKICEAFLVTTSLEKVSKVRFKFCQKIYKKIDHTLCVSAESYVCMVKNARPIVDSYLCSLCE